MHAVCCSRRRWQARRCRWCGCRAVRVRGARPAGTGRRVGKLEGVFDGEAVGKVVADGGVAADALGQGHAVGGVAAFEQLLDSFVDEPEARLHREDRLADDGEAEVPRFDEAGVDRTDRDLVDARSLHVEEGKGLRGRRSVATGVMAKWVPPVGPVLVVHEPAEDVVVERYDTVQVVRVHVRNARRERQDGEARYCGGVGRGGGAVRRVSRGPLVSRYTMRSPSPSSCYAATSASR